MQWKPICFRCFLIDMCVNVITRFSPDRSQKPKWPNDKSACIFSSTLQWIYILCLEGNLKCDCYTCWCFWSSLLQLNQQQNQDNTVNGFPRCRIGRASNRRATWLAAWCIQNLACLHFIHSTRVDNGVGRGRGWMVSVCPVTEPTNGVPSGLGVSASDWRIQVNWVWKARGPQMSPWWGRQWRQMTSSNLLTLWRRSIK